MLAPNARIHTVPLKDYYKKQFLRLLDLSHGTKAIVWDNSLTGPIGLITDYNTLLEHDVQKMFPLVNELPSSHGCVNIIYVVRPKFEHMETISKHMLSKPPGANWRCRIIFVPNKSCLCEKLLEKLGVLGNFEIDEFNFYFIPLDSDLLSMQDDSCLRNCLVSNDKTCLFNVAKGIMTLQNIYGIIPNIYGKGACAKRVADLIVKMQRDFSVEKCPTSVIDNLIIIDRTVDFLTPLLSAFTYEALIDQFFSISNASIKIPIQNFVASDLNSDNTNDFEVSQDVKKITLNSSDQLYYTLRNKHISSIGRVLTAKAKSLSEIYEEKNQLQSISEMKHFIKKLPQYQSLKQSLSIHTTLAEMIKSRIQAEEFIDTIACEQQLLFNVPSDAPVPYIEDCLIRKESLLKVLRLICLHSCACSGLKQKLLEFYKREIIQIYGCKYTVSLHNLETSGLLSASYNKNLSSLKSSLNLVQENVDEQEPRDVAYIFSGFAPLSIRLIQMLLRKDNWQQAKTVLDQLSGPTVFESQRLPCPMMRSSSTLSLPSLSSKYSEVSNEQQINLVVFIGGITWAEISALRFISQQEESSSEFLIASTSILNGEKLIKSLLDYV